MKCQSTCERECVCASATVSLRQRTISFPSFEWSETKINIFLILNFAITLKIECKSDEHTSQRQRDIEKQQEAVKVARTFCAKKKMKLK